MISSTLTTPERFIPESDNISRRKYISHVSHLDELLDRLKAQYYFPDWDEITGNHFQTFYMDTPDYTMYNVHQKKSTIWETIRLRKDVDMDTDTLEVKHENRKGITSQNSIAIDASDTLQNEHVRDFLQKYALYYSPDLKFVLGNDFQRITLVNPTQDSRITIDYNICFQNMVTGEEAGIPSLMIISVKQNPENPHLQKVRLSDKKIKPINISKYCIGSILTDPELKCPFFLKKVNQINELLTYYYKIKPALL